MILLHGEFDLSLDAKNRLSIPSRVREQIDPDFHGEGFFLTIEHRQALSLYPEKIYQRIALAVAPGMAAPDEFLAYERVNFALASKVELDRQGRVLLPEKAIRRTGLSEQVTMIGSRDHLEIWDTQVWEKYLENGLGHRERIMLQARYEMFVKERQEAGF